MAKIAEYMLDEGTGTTAADSVASYDGTLDGSISWASGGVKGSAYGVSPGATSKVHIPDVLTVSIGTNFGASAWVRRTAGSSGRHAIFSPEFNYNSFEFCICCANGTADTFSLDYGAAWVAGYGLPASTTFALNQWYHLAATARFSSASISDCGDNGSGAIRVTANGHGFSTGRAVRIRNVTGTTEANGAWSITVIDGNTFDLDGSTFTSTYTSGGTACVGEVEFWVDSVSQGVSNLDTTVMGADDGGDDWSIGSQEDNYSPNAYGFQFTDGKIDLVSLYNSALDQAEVDAIYGDGPEGPVSSIPLFCNEDDMQQAFQLNQNSTAMTFAMRSSTSGLLVTGLTPTIRLSKNGDTFAAAAGAVGEMSLGWYSVAPSATDFNTLGPLKLLATAANCITTVRDYMVIGYSPTVGLPSIAPGLSGGLLVGSGTGTVVLTTGGVASANVTTWNGTAVATPATAGHPVVTVKVGTGTGELSLSSGVVRAADASGANVATSTALATAQTSLNTIAGYIDTEVAAIKAKTDNLPDTPASVSDIPTASLIAATVNSVLTSSHGSGSWSTGSTLTTADIPTAAAIASAVGGGTTSNTGLSRDRVLEAIAGACCSVITGAGTSTNVVKHFNATTANLTVTVDSSGNRSAVTIS